MRVDSPLVLTLVGHIATTWDFTIYNVISELPEKRPELLTGAHEVSLIHAHWCTASSDILNMFIKEGISVLV